MITQDLVRRTKKRVRWANLEGAPCDPVKDISSALRLPPGIPPLDMCAALRAEYPLLCPPVSSTTDIRSPLPSAVGSTPHIVKVLIDTGATGCLISAKVAARLQAVQIPCAYVLRGFDGVCCGVGSVCTGYA